jgi:hypothetical protein
MLIFSISFPDLIKFPYLWIPLKEGFGVKGGPKTRVTLQIILVFTLTFTCTSCVSVFDKYLHWPSISVNIYIYTLQQDKCKCKKFGHVGVNDLHLHWIYTPYIQLLTFTHTTMLWSRYKLCDQACTHSIVNRVILQMYMSCSYQCRFGIPTPWVSFHHANHDRFPI